MTCSFDDIPRYARPGVAILMCLVVPANVACAQEAILHPANATQTAVHAGEVNPGSNSVGVSRWRRARKQTSESVAANRNAVSTESLPGEWKSPSRDEVVPLLGLGQPTDRDRVHSPPGRVGRAAAGEGQTLPEPAARPSRREGEIRAAQRIKSWTASYAGGSDAIASGESHRLLSGLNTPTLPNEQVNAATDFEVESTSLTDFQSPAYGELPAPVIVNPFAPRVTYNPCLPEAEPTTCWALSEHFLEALQAPAEPLAHAVAKLLHIHHDKLHAPLHYHPIPIQGIPERPELPVETNELFLAPGFLEQGIVLKTGAVWRPAFWVFGTFRTGLHHFNNRDGNNVTEWVNRLDLFGQMNLTGTERLLVGLRPLDEELRSSRRFTGTDLRNGRGLDGWNIDLQTLFFEGDFGEIFPCLDPCDELALDYGFSVGRQPMLFQQGVLINEDRIDALTVTRNTLYGDGVLNLRATGVYAWNEINRNNNVHDPDAQLVGLFTETDIQESTINADVAYVHSESSLGSVVAFGLSGIQRLHGFHNTYNSSLHLLASFPTEGETPASGQGELLFSQLSWTPHHSNDLVYLNGFWAIDQFTSPARGPLAGGPLGQTGILFSAPGLGSFGAPLSNQAGNAAGGSLGYQLFFEHTRRQVIFEFGGRSDTDGTNQSAIAGGSRYQQAIGQHWIFIVDTFLSKRESRGLSPGFRFEFLAKF